MNTKQAIEWLEKEKNGDNYEAIEEIIELLQESKIIVTLERLDKRLKKVEKLADENWCSHQYILEWFKTHPAITFEEPFETDGVDDIPEETYNGKPISEIKVGGTD